MKKEFVNIHNTKGRGHYASVIKAIRDKKVCPFCPNELKNHHKKPILHIGKYWLATDNMYPYKNARWHLLFIHKNHVEDIRKLKTQAWTELLTLSSKILDKRKIKGGTLMLRFGDTNCTGASVAHLHAMIVSAGPAKIQTRPPVMVRVA